jgi:hypothetical protein
MIEIEKTYLAKCLPKGLKKYPHKEIIDSAPPLIDDEQITHMVNNYSLLESNKNLNKKSRFDLGTEKLLIHKWLSRTKFTSINNELYYNKEHIWKSFIEIFSISKYQSVLIEVIKRDIPEDRAKAIPYFNNIIFRNLIYYLNTMRTDANAQAFYRPVRKVNVGIDFFEASDSIVKRKDEWNLYSEHPIKIHPIKGDHFSIFNPGYVEKFSILFNNLIQL